MDITYYLQKKLQLLAYSRNWVLRSVACVTSVIPVALKNDTLTILCKNLQLLSPRARSDAYLHVQAHCLHYCSVQFQLDYF